MPCPKRQKTFDACALGKSQVWNSRDRLSIELFLALWPKEATSPKEMELEESPFMAPSLLMKASRERLANSKLC